VYLKINLISIKAIIIIRKKRTPNLIICFSAQGEKFPSPAEYRAAVPIVISIKITNIKKKFKFKIFLKIM
jgi:hypothetical protein